MKRVVILFILSWGSLLFSQPIFTQEDLLKKAEENYRLVETEPEAAFKETYNIIREATRSNNQEAELRALVTRCFYYRIKNDFENMIIAARSLLQKAEKYDNHTYQTIAKNYFFEVYNFNKLYDKAVKELEQGLQIINRKKTEDSLSIVAKANIYISFANYFAVRNDFGNRIKYIKLSLAEHEKFSDEIYRQQLQFLDYSNLAAVYMDLNTDSAKHYAELSLSKDNGWRRSDGIRFLNFSILGEIELKNKKYENAIYYFKKAEKVVDYKNPVNVKNLYRNLIETYKILKDDQRAKLYEAKRDSFSLGIVENQNRSLHNLLKEQEKNDKSDLIYIFGAFCFFAFVLSFFVIRKNIILAKQEKVSEDYLKRVTESQAGITYSKLVEMLKRNDVAFMVHFEEAFPEFSSKLIKLNSQISHSEIEFSALLKMKLPTKEIARYKYIAPKTVQNKKHLIRKKLNIPKDIDIYQWFEDL
ncbi:tetratricopeptide repeat protein [Moheibacter sediminis]|uniref:Regulatory protein, luxR family n=1 Tax=Moheibacter sediminis TaxID=1434700 RepID=A0A1W1YA60_9FLAO|nr:hypothetical protein [Moheibacter sediminis]SMC32994.1 hypothetical protein SAMN06296427_101164 [Moheibacter sediminis]